MRDREENRELGLLLSLGLISADEVAELDHRAREAGKTLLDLLHDDGFLSQDTLIRLRSQTPSPRPGAAAPGPDDETLLPPLPANRQQQLPPRQFQDETLLPLPQSNPQRHLSPAPPVTDGETLIPQPKDSKQRSYLRTSDQEQSRASDNQTSDPARETLHQQTTADQRHETTPDGIKSVDSARSFHLRIVDEVSGNDWVSGRVGGRYDLVSFLGKGGMGLVYHAFDIQLKRHVALKFLRSSDPELLDRFIREARAQAGVEHENICKVYEVNEVRGEPFISMQFIRGKTLAEMAEDMTMEQILLAMKQVAEGVHEAHRSGLIHRDLKPGNIMVEHLENGVFKPYVLDFGVARFSADQGLTMEGAIVGTPSYMSPEQARGEIDRLDRRTDVYSLGATLYHLLVGAPPFTGTSQVAVLQDILAREPVNPRQIRPDLPKDVATITLKCLEKERDARYESARAMATDLGHYLDGEPIEARAASAFYRLGKRIKKNRATFAVGLAALILLTASLGWGLWRSARREELARNLTSHVKEIEALARYSHLSPRHDIRPDRQRLRDRMALIQKEMDRVGSMARGPGNYALGWSYLVLSDLKQARAHLDEAWASGYHHPQVAYALGLCYSALYREGLQETLLSIEKEDRAERIELLKQQLRNPALVYMKQGEKADQAMPTYLEAMIALCDERYDDALKVLEQHSNLPWFYEALKLKADVYREKAIQSEGQGDKATAVSFFEQAFSAYSAASAVAESDPDLYRTQIKAMMLNLAMQVDGLVDLASYNARIQKQIDFGLSVAPEDGEIMLLDAQFLRFQSQFLKVRMEDPTQLLESAAAMANRAREFLGEPWRADQVLASVYRSQAQWLVGKKEDPGNWIQQALDALARIPDQERDYRYYLDLGKLWQSRADTEEDCSFFDLAINAFQQSITLANHRFENYYCLSACLYKKATGPCAANQQMHLLEQAAEAVEKSIQLSPDRVSPYFLGGRIQTLLGRGGNPTLGIFEEAPIQRAYEYFVRVTQLSPKVARWYLPLAQTLLIQARSQWEKGLACQQYFDEAFQVCQTGLALNSELEPLRSTLAFIHYYQGKFLVREGRDPGDHLKEAYRLAGEVKDGSLGSLPLITRGSALRLQAEWMLIQGQDPRPQIAKAEALFQSLLAVEPENAEAHRTLGLLAMLETMYCTARGLNSEIPRKKSASELQMALKLEPEAPYFSLAEARRLFLEANLCRERPDQINLIRSGLTRLEKILKTRPTFAEASILKQCFEVLQENESGKDQIEKLQDLLRECARTMPGLTPQWRTYLPQPDI